MNRDWEETVRKGVSGVHFAVLVSNSPNKGLSDHKRKDGVQERPTIFLSDMSYLKKNKLTFTVGFEGKGAKMSVHKNLKVRDCSLIYL